MPHFSAPSRRSAVGAPEERVRLLLLAFLFYLLFGLTNLEGQSGVAIGADRELLDEPGTCEVVVEERALPGELEWARDVRWATEDKLFLAAPDVGVFRLNLVSGDYDLVVPRGQDSSSVWAPGFLGASAKYLAVGAPFFEVAWVSLEENMLRGKVAVPVTADLDVQGDRMLVVGVMGDEEPAPDGAIAWLASIAGGETGLRPVLFSGEGPGARSMVICSRMEVTASRFLPDGSVVIVPGVEDGAYEFGPDGLLARTWQSDDLGIDTDCKLADEDVSRFALSAVPRREWVNRRRIVDEVLPRAEGPVFVIREVRAGRVVWELKHAGSDPGVESCRLPLSSTSVNTRLKGDMRGARVALLLYAEGPALAPGSKPEVPPRLLVGKLERRR